MTALLYTSGCVFFAFAAGYYLRRSLDLSSSDDAWWALLYLVNSILFACLIP